VVSFLQAFRPHNCVSPTGSSFTPRVVLYAQCRPVSPQTGGRSRRATEQGACKSSGPYCEGCDRLVVCANLGERGLTAIANITCSEIDSEMSCSKSSCTTKPETTQPCEGSDKAGAFRCLQPGFFPDPTDCKLFHFCGSDLSHLQGKQFLTCDTVII
jgi:hypothetical protein